MIFGPKFSICHPCYSVFLLESLFFQFNPPLKNKYNWTLIWSKKGSAMQKTNSRTRLNFLKNYTIIIHIKI